MFREVCPKCGNQNFAVVKDMTSRRMCKCGNSWSPPEKNSGEFAKPPVVLGKELSEKLEFAEGFLMIAKFNDHIEVVCKADIFLGSGLIEILRDHIKGTLINMRT